MRTTWSRSRPTRVRLVLLAVIVAALALALGAAASHPESSLAGSDFEIDTNANLKVDDPPPSIDWASVNQVERDDLETGANDDSYAGGSKEDDPCPGTTTGSIPNNKSDLLTFGAYVEEEAGGPGYLNLFWTRVQEPNGTTLMDFELNQSSTDCGNGVNPERTAGDLLVEYRIEQGGATAQIKVREWTGSAWGPANDLTGTAAAGTINTTAIPAAESDGLSTSDPISPRTFGEAQLDLDFILDEGSCQSFGSAFLKSRASDSFTSQMKDFIKPVGVNITNCGSVTIRKETDPNGATALFGYTHDLDTDPAQADDPATPGIDESTEFRLSDGGSKSFTSVLFGSYSVNETSVPSGWAFVNVDCSASSGVTPVIAGAQVTFDIDNAADSVDCTYNNRQQTGAIRITKTRKHAASGPGNHAHPGVTFTVTGGSLPAAGTTVVTGADGKACVDGLVLSSVAGNYTVTETVPAGYVPDGATAKQVAVTTEATCSSGTPAPVSFANTPLTNITVSVDSQVNGGTNSTIDCDAAPDPPFDASGGDVTHTLSNKVPGTYTCVIVVDP